MPPTPPGRHVQSFSRLVWPFYMFFMSWIVLPFYATAAARILPLSDTDVDRMLMLAVVAAGPLAAWSGLRGGPLLMSEAQVLMGLATGRDRTTRIAVVRQAMFVGGFFGLGAAWLTAMATGGNPEVVHSAQRTMLGLEAGVLIVALAVLWNVDGNRWLDRGLAVVVTGGMSAAVMVGETPESWIGRLGLLAVFTMSVAVYRSPDVRLDHLWSRSLVLAELQYGAALLDFRSALASLRSTRDGPRSARGRASSSRLPAWAWRPLRSLASSPALVPLRVVMMVAAVAVSVASLTGTAARLSVVAGILAIGAVDLSAPLASVVSRPILHRGSRIPERVTLAVESLIGITLTGLLGLAGFAAVASRAESLGLPAVAAVAFAAGGASVLQARMGSPDLVAMIDRFGPEQVRVALTARSATPIALLFLTVGGVVELTKTWRPIMAELIAFAWIVALTVATNPKPDSR